MSDRTRWWSNGLVGTPEQRRALTRSIEPAASGATLSIVEKMAVFQMLVLGSAMQAYANGAIEAILVALLLLVAGMAVVGIVFPGRRAEMRAFLLTYAVCIFVGGLAQCYSLAVFDKIQSTDDAPTFFWRIQPRPPFRTLATVPNINSPLAVVIWQQIYKVTWWLGFQHGPYTAVMFNAWVMGGVGGLTVQIGRELLGDDAWRLRRAGSLVASCGLSILFGAILLRDCFTTFFNTLVLWGLIRWLVRPTSRRLLLAAALTGISAWAMEYLRPETVPLFAVYWLLLFLFWLVGRAGSVRFFTFVLALCAMLVAASYLAGSLQDTLDTRTLEMEKYARLGAERNPEDSLGMRLVVNQPLPIRVVAGIGRHMISPIPLWALFKIGSLDYDWIKGYNGIYKVLVMPLVFMGILKVVRMLRMDRRRSFPLVFLVMYFLINTIGVVATSLEQRHIGQFLSSFVIIAALPDTRELKVNDELRETRLWWFVGVALVHLAWAMLKLVI